LDGLRAQFSASPLAELYRSFQERVDNYLSTPPPPDWDGTHTFDTK
jgi:hypothetical protein